MIYPISPEYLENAPESLVNIYQRLDESILEYICEQFKTGELNTKAIDLIRLLQRRGLDLSEIEKIVKKYTALSDRQLNDIYNDAISKNQEYYSETLQKRGLVEDAVRRTAIQQEVNAISRQTIGDFRNLTKSLGFALRGADGKVMVLPILETYRSILDDAEIQILSGGTSYNDAIRNAVKRLSDSGLQWVDYDTGYHNRIDVAARRAVMSGITQISAKYSDNLAEELNTPYVEVTAHIGARDIDGKTPWASHKAWQGKVYSRRSGDIYPSVYEVCGLGQVDGLCGVNCRHHYHPWVEGVSERTYTDEQLANIDQPPFEFEGKKYTMYEATQKQRQIETVLRQNKRDMNACKAAGLTEDYTTAKIRYQTLLAEYNKFSKAAGLPTQPERYRVNN